MPADLLVDPAILMLQWLQHQNRRLAAGDLRFELLQPAEVAAAVRCLLLVVSHCAPAHHLQLAAAAASGPTLLHLLQQHALQPLAALSTYSVLLLAENMKASSPKASSSPHAACQPPPLAPAPSTLTSPHAQSQEGEPSPHVSRELYDRLDRALLAFLSQKVCSLFSETDGGRHDEVQKRQAHMQGEEALMSGSIFSGASEACAELLLRPLACAAVRLEAGGELLQQLLLLQQHGGALPVPQQTALLAALAATARNFFLQPQHLKQRLKALQGLCEVYRHPEVCTAPIACALLWESLLLLRSFTAGPGASDSAAAPQQPLLPPLVAPILRLAAKAICFAPLAEMQLGNAEKQYSPAASVAAALERPEATARGNGQLLQQATRFFGGSAAFGLELFREVSTQQQAWQTREGELWEYLLQQQQQERTTSHWQETPPARRAALLASAVPAAPPAFGTYLQGEQQLHYGVQQEQKRPLASALRLQWLAHAFACGKYGALQCPEELFPLLQDVRGMVRAAEDGVMLQLAAGRAMLQQQDTAVRAHDAESAAAAGAEKGSTAASLPERAPEDADAGAGERQGAAAASAAVPSGSSKSASYRKRHAETAADVGVDWRLAAEPLFAPPDALLHLLSVFLSPFWLEEVLPAVAAAGNPLRESIGNLTSPQKGLSVLVQPHQHEQQQLQKRLEQLLLQKRLLKLQELLADDVARLQELQQQQAEQLRAFPEALRALRQQKPRQEARAEGLLQRQKLQQCAMEADASERRSLILSSACAALAFAQEHFRQALLQQLLLPRMQQQELFLHRMEALMQRCRRLGFLRRQLKKTGASSDSKAVSGVEGPPQQPQQQDTLRQEVLHLLASGFQEFLVLLREAEGLQRAGLPHASSEFERLRAALLSPQQQQEFRRDAFAAWAFLLEDSLCASKQQAHQDQQDQELQQLLFGALAMRIRNQTAAGLQPLDVSELLSADCPLPPRVSAALFSSLYRHSLPLLLHPEQQQQLLFAAFRAEQEQRWATSPGARDTLLTSISPVVIRGYLADAWLTCQRHAECEQLPSLLAYASQVAVFAAASVAAVPSPLLPQEVATLWKQHHQFQLLERRADTDVATELPRAAVRRKGPGHGLSTTELQQRIGTVLQQPLLQVVHQCSRLSLAICAWGHFESLALQQLLQLAAVAVHALLPIASLWLQMQQQALRQAAASGGTHPPMLVQQQQQLSRARAAIEEATGDLGLVVSLLEAFCPQTLHAARAAAHPQGGLDDACSFVEETKAADVREAPPEDDALDTTRGAETASAAHFLSAASAPEAQAAAESETADAETTQDDAMSSEEATARASNSRSGDWNSLEAEVVTALRVLLPEAEGPPAKAAHIRLRGVVVSTKTSEGESQRQAQQRPLLLAFIAPADTQGRRQGILLPKKLLQLLVLRRLGWEVRLVNLSDCRGKGPLELQQLLADILHAGENSSCLWDLHHKVQGGGTIESGGLPHSPSKM
ncbi:hypothetical protein cyc_04584 [Cyclospora cayetanensis]|uniref:Uncharacterized protein n=1 Tax=Cyclospora cayetanensis TaxID=88456 RepID=A0A1D3DAT0_9EIME|nr:hypothetical protein cyc_04584 [Cyclospora cayetanensis]